MTFESGMSGLQLRSLVKSNGELELSLVAIPTPKPGADEVVVRVEAAPMTSEAIFTALQRAVTNFETDVFEKRAGASLLVSHTAFCVPKLIVTPRCVRTEH